MAWGIAHTFMILAFLFISLSLTCAIGTSIIRFPGQEQVSLISYFSMTFWISLVLFVHCSSPYYSTWLMPCCRFSISERHICLSKVLLLILLQRFYKKSCSSNVLHDIQAANGAFSPLLSLTCYHSFPTFWFILFHVRHFGSFNHDV